MDDLRTRALLVDFDPARIGTGAIGTVVSRDEFADTAARGEFPATLLLDLDRVEMQDGGEVIAHAQVAVDWDEDTLGQLLASTDENEIALWFDERELSRAFDEGDVEAHGLRQRAAVVALTVVAAGASVTPALASTQADHTGGGAATPAVAGSSDPGRPLQVNPQTAPTQAPISTAAPTVTSSGGGLSSGEITAIAAGAGAVLISAAGFGAARRRTPPAQPA